MTRKSGGWLAAGIGGLAGGGMPALWPHLRLEDAPALDQRLAEGPGPSPLLRPAGGQEPAPRLCPSRERCPARPRP